MQLIASFDQRSPQRLVVTLVSATALMIVASSRARGVSAPVVLADLEPDRRGVRAHRVARLVHARADRDDAAEATGAVPATVATRSSLIPFWKSTTTPSGSRR